MKKLLFLILFGLLALTTQPLFAKPIHLSGSSTMAPAINKALVEFQKTHKRSKFDVASKGSETGLADLQSGAADAALVSRALTADEQKSLKSFPVAYDAVVPVVSMEIFILGVHDISLENLRKAYTGKIKNWKELGGPSQDIVTVDFDETNATRAVFMKTLFDNAASTTSAKRIAHDMNEMKFAVASSSGMLGYASAAWTAMNMRALGIKVNKGPVLYPTRENVLYGGYSFARPLNIVTRGEPTAAIKEFIDFLLSKEGKEILRKEKFATY